MRPHGRRGTEIGDHTRSQGGHRAWRAWRAWVCQVLLLLIAVHAATAVGVPTVQAQDDLPEVAIIHTAPGTPQPERLPLNVFFTLVDEDRKPLVDPPVESASIQVLNAEAASAPAVSANVEDPRTPIYIVLLIDTSGSMAPYLGKIKEAAKAAVAQAPPNAFIGVIPFNQVNLDQQLAPLTGFINDRKLLEGDIDAVNSTGSGPTCLYNAAYNAIKLLDEQVQKPEDRRAIILFTDGRDEVTNGNPCSQRTLENVIDLATAERSKATPIFTVGLQEGANSRLLPDVLQRLATATNAYFAIGNLDAMNDTFQAIMGYLKSQRLASADVSAKLGGNDAILRVKLQGIKDPLTAPFRFTSPATIGPKGEAPIGIQFQSVKPCPDPAECWMAELAVSNPGAFSSVLVKVSDVATNGELYQLRSAPADNLTIRLDASRFERDREYRIDVYALDSTDGVIPRPPPDATGTPQAEQASFKIKQRLPDSPPPVEFSIIGVKADIPTQAITVTLGVTEPQRIYDYQLTLLDGDGQQVYGGPRVRYQPLAGATAPAIVEAMPAAMRNIKNSRQYKAILDIWTREDRQSRAESDFSAIPPPPPPWWQGLVDNWPVVLLLAVLAALLILLIPLQRRRKLEPPKNLYGSNGAADAVNPPSLDANMRLRVKLTRAPQATRPLDQLITKFPCVIGRQDTCDVDLSQVTPNRRISRRHLEISVKNGEFYLCDLNSDNGTLLNKERLAPGIPVRLPGNASLRLGPDVILELRPESNHSV